MKTSILLLCFFSLVCISLGNNIYRLNAEIGGGLSYKTTQDINTNFNYNNTGFVGMLRLKWIPEHRLRIGFESGLFRLFTIQTGNNVATKNDTIEEEIKLNAVPLLLDFSMNFNNIEIIAGVGYYNVRLQSNSKKPEFSIASSDWSMGYMLGINYKIHITNTLSLAPELKYFLITELQHNTLAFQINLNWDLIQW